MTEKNKVMKFNYTDAKGKHTTRTAYMLHNPSDMYLALDLTEFDQEDQAEYIKMLEELDKVFFDTIKEIGLGKQFRYFKPERLEKME